MKLAIDTPHRDGSDTLSQWFDCGRSTSSSSSSSSSSQINRGKLHLSGRNWNPGYTMYGVGKGVGVGKRPKEHYHEIVICRNELFVDGGSLEKRDDPKYSEFFKSIENYGCPAEFEEDGVHSISVFVGFGGPKLGVKGMHEPNARREMFEKFIAKSTKKRTGTGASYYGF